MLKAVFVVMVAIFITANSFSFRSKNSVQGEGIASGNIHFIIQAGNKNSTTNQLTYGDVTAPIENVVVLPNKKMATVYFTHHNALLGITVINGKNGKPDKISDPFPVDEETYTVRPQLHYNDVTSGSIEVK